MPNSYALLTTDKTTTAYPPGPAIYTAPPAPESTPPAFYLISGVVSHTGTNFSVGVEVQGYGTIFSDAVTGSYGAFVAPGYSGTVLPHYCSGDWTPSIQSYVNVQADQPNQNFDLAAVTNMDALTWLVDSYHLNQEWDGTVGVSGDGTASGSSGTFYAFALGDGDGFAHMNAALAYCDATLVNFDTPYPARIEATYSGTQYTTNTGGGGVANTSGLVISINGTEGTFFNWSNGTFSGSVYVDGTITTGCNDLHVEWQNYVGQAVSPPKHFYAQLESTFTVYPL